MNKDNVLMSSFLFVVGKNQLDGTVPSELGGLTNLWELGLGKGFCVLLPHIESRASENVSKSMTIPFSISVGSRSI